MSATYSEMCVSTALTQLKRKVPYGWDLNLYRGCEHGCQYCYAMYTHDYLAGGDFFTDIHCKTNIIELLDKALSSPNWKREVVNIGGVTDSYQPAEAQYKLMRDVLKLMIKHKTPAIISSKSSLILRDYDLIDELSRLTYVNVAQTITTMDESVRKKMEPCSANSLSRFEVLKQFRKTNASIGLHVMPIVPYLTDSYENFDRLFAAAAEVKVDYVLPGTLYLRGKTRPHFFAFIEREYPQLLQPLKALYGTGGADKGYKDELYKRVNALRDQYELSSSYMQPMRERLNRQLSFSI